MRNRPKQLKERNPIKVSDNVNQIQCFLVYIYCLLVGVLTSGLLRCCSYTVHLLEFYRSSNHTLTSDDYSVASACILCVAACAQEALYTCMYLRSAVHVIWKAPRVCAFMLSLCFDVSFRSVRCPYFY